MTITPQFELLHAGEHNAEILHITVDEMTPGMAVKLVFFTPAGRSYVGDVPELSAGEADFTLPAALLDGPGKLFAQLLLYKNKSFVKKSRVYEFFVLPSADFHLPTELADEGLLSFCLLSDEIRNVGSAVFTLIDADSAELTNAQLLDSAAKFENGTHLIILRDEYGYHPATQLSRSSSSVVVTAEYVHDGSLRSISYTVSTAAEDADDPVSGPTVRTEPLTGSAETKSSPKRNSRLLVAQLLDVAWSYYRNRGSEENGYNFTYGHGTCLSPGFDPETDTELDCSTFAGLVLRGIPFHKSPYKAVIRTAGLPVPDSSEEPATDDSEEEAAGGGDQNGVTKELPANAAYPWAVDPGSFLEEPENGEEPTPVRTAAQLGKWLYDSGRELKYAADFTDVEPGDLIFYAFRRSDDPSAYIDPDRFRRISHVALCVNRIYTADAAPNALYNKGDYCYVTAAQSADTALEPGLYRCSSETVGIAETDKWEYIAPGRYRHTMLEATNAEKVILNRTLEARLPHRICMIARPDLGSLTDGELRGNLTSALGITDLNNAVTDCFGYLTSAVTEHLPPWLGTTGVGCTLSVRTAYRKNGQPYSVQQTLTDTRSGNEICTRSKYLLRMVNGNETYLRPDDPAAEWTDWHLTVNDAALNAFADGNGLGRLIYANGQPGVSGARTPIPPMFLLTLSADEWSSTGEQTIDVPGVTPQKLTLTVPLSDEVKIVPTVCGNGTVTFRANHMTGQIKKDTAVLIAVFDN